MNNEICIYADVLFLENLCIDYVILILTDKLIRHKQKTNPLRILLGASIGAIYAVVITVFPFMSKYAILSLTLKILISIMMCIASFPLKNMREFFISIFGLYLFTFLLAGIFISLISMGLPASVASGGAVVVWGSVPILYLIETIIFGYIIISVVLFLVKTHKNINKNIEKLYISFFDKEIFVSALVDTGNELCDPINRLPVVICEINSLKSILPKSVTEAAENGRDVAEAFVNENILNRYAVIPYKSIGVENGVMHGFKADCVYVNENQKMQAVVCLINNKLSASNEYNAIMPFGIIKNERIYNQMYESTGGDKNEYSDF